MAGMEYPQKDSVLRTLGPACCTCVPRLLPLLRGHRGIACPQCPVPHWDKEFRHLEQKTLAQHWPLPERLKRSPNTEHGA